MQSFQYGHYTKVFQASLGLNRVREELIYVIFIDQTTLQVRSAVYGSFLSPLDFAIFKQQQDLEEAILQCKTPNSLANMSLPNLMDLDEILKEQDSQNLLFFLETSDKSQVTVRQSCALESAAKFSGRVVLLLVTSPVGNFCSLFLFYAYFLSNII